MMFVLELGRGLVLGTLLVWSWQPASARADLSNPPAPPPVEPEQLSAAPVTQESGIQAESERYRQLIALALGEYNRGNFAEADALIREAHALSPSARTLRGLGMMQFELKHYVASVTLLEQALASDVKQLTGEMRRATEDLLGRARAYTARLRLDVTPVEGVRVEVDGAQVTPTEAGELRLDVGSHQIHVSAPGYVAETRSLEVTGGSSRELRVVLHKPGETRATERQKRPLYRNPWLWTTLGVVVVGGAVGGGIAAARSGGTAEPYTGGGLEPLPAK